jgi:agmatine deiminase
MNLQFRFILLSVLLSLLSVSRVKAQSIISNTPPQGTLRTMAEWEEVQALVVTWRDYKATLAEIIRYAQEECQVIVHATNAATAQSELVNTYGVALGPNVTFLSQPNNSLWIRDYGANSVYINGVDSLFLVDWRYNRPNRPQDDTIPRRYARELGLNLVQSTVEPNRVVHTGGNFMSDGFGTGFSSELILNENPNKTEAQIDQIHNSFMGLSRYVKMPVLPYDGINHIDMHMKLLDEETLIWAQYPQGVADGPQIEANILYVLDNYMSVFGTPYKIVRVVAPPDYNNNGTPIYPNNGGDYRTFSNSVFVNKSVLLPVYEERFDTTAIRIYQENLPGYRIVPINCTNIIAASGAIHCITHSVGVNDPMLISHQKLNDTYDTENPYVVNALIRHRSGIQSAQVFYTTDTTAGFQSLNMTPVPGSDNWTAAIPAQPGNTDVYYYIQGNSESGKIQVRPITAPEGRWKFRVLDTGTVTSNGLPLVERLLQAEVFPNPSDGITCVSLKSPDKMPVDIRVFDITGREIEALHKGFVAGGEQRYYLNTETWNAGVYLVKIHTPFGDKVMKLMVR